MVKRNFLTLRNKFSAQWLPDCRYVGKRLGKITRIGRTRNQRDEKVPRSGSKYNDQNSYPADLTPTFYFYLNEVVFLGSRLIYACK